MSDSELLGKKVFFFYPPSWLKDEMIRELVENEYEAYVIDDHRILFPLVKTLNDAVIFVNIDSGPPEPEWEKYIRLISESELRERVKIGRSFE